MGSWREAACQPVPSCESRYLWDARAGGILLDQGFIKARPVGSDGKTWRVTIRKVLRFADRTPSSWGDTPLQFGESLNYLAPAALSWWLQSDLYAAERHAEGLLPRGDGEEADEERRGEVSDDRDDRLSAELTRLWDRFGFTLGATASSVVWWVSATWTCGTGSAPTSEAGTGTRRTT